MELVLISGRSGSGKTTALQVLEDLGYYCVDNLPLGLLTTLVDQLHTRSQTTSNIAVGIDARNLPLRQRRRTWRSTATAAAAQMCQ